MAAPPSTPGTPITDRRQLVEYLESGCKPPDRWRIGTEHEKFVFQLGSLRPAPYNGARASIRGLLEGLTRFGWQPVVENGNPIALVKDGCNITLEPGGQFELSGAPLETIHQTCNEVHAHLNEVKTVAGEIGVGLLGVGFQPKWSRADTPWMPKGRYRIMGDYMPKRGTLGLDMMLRTCTVQVNHDFESEADMVLKFRVGLALQPIAVAMFADSPFAEGRPTGYLSYRSHVWEDTDPDRCGILPFVFEDGMGFERYVDYMLDVPMYFVYRDGRYIDAAGQSFRDFLAGRLPALPGELPTTGDWSDHLTTVFPEVRLKTYLEMRGADGGPWRRLCALPALWTGLFYDADSLQGAADLVRRWSVEDHDRLRREVPRLGLAARLGNRTVRDIAAEVLEISGAGLRRRNRLDSMGADESGFLGTLYEIVDSGRTPAEEKLERFNGPWAGDIDRLFSDYAY
jgi:glutamate--cysteine ligase